MWQNILKRLQEPSTHAGIASLVSFAMLFGLPVTVGQMVTQGVVAATGIAAIILPENKAQ